jgi:hypothetical protein
MYCTRAKRALQTLCAKKGHLFGKRCPVTTQKAAFHHVMSPKVLPKLALFILT